MLQYLRSFKRRYLQKRTTAWSVLAVIIIFNLFLLYPSNTGHGQTKSVLCYYPVKLFVPPRICDENRTKMRHAVHIARLPSITDLALDDILSMKPPIFLKNYKNPCWRDDGNGKLRCLPYFMIIGLDKCATTDLFNRIIKHPQILNNTGDLGKEPLWWAWRRYGYGYYWFKDKPMEDFQQYLGYFDKAAGIIDRTETTEGFHNLITVDGSVVDMWDFSSWPQIHQNKGLKEPRVLTPHLIKHLNPDTKFMLMLRDPVERLYSDYFYWKLSDPTKEEFHRQVIKSLKTFEECERANSMKSCAYNRTFHLAVKARVHVGFYALYLKEWLEVFPRSQFLILRMEDYADNRAATVKRIFDFLDIKSLPKSDLDLITAGKPQYVTELKQKAGPMLDTTRSILKKIYIPHNKDLANLLNDKSFRWGY